MLDFYDAILGAETLGGGGGGGSATLITKNIDANGTYSASSDNADGYSAVTVTVPNTYTASDEGKVVDNGALVAQTSSSTTSNGTVDTTTISSLTVNVANSYSAGDEGKVVDNGELVAQTAYPSTVTTNGTITTTTNNSVTIDVANSYTQADNGKVVSNQQLVAQTAYPSTITSNNTYDTTNYNSITVNVSGGGGTPVESKDVNFYDYDGTIVYSYTAAEFAQLSALPANPTHTGLTSQGWNWTLSDAQTYVASYGMLDIGQMYVTDDGKTRLYVDIISSNYKIDIQLYNGPASFSVNWGDESQTETISQTGAVTISHTYTNAGKYVISISNSRYINLNKASYSNINIAPCLYKIELGNTFFLEADFGYYHNLSSITFPDNYQAQFRNIISCYSLKHITIPSSCTSFYGNNTNNSYLRSISIPKSITSFPTNYISQCNNIKRICYPPTITSTPRITQCQSLQKVVIPSSVTSIEAQSFYMCFNLTSVEIPSSVTSIGASVFRECLLLTSVEIPSSVTSIGDATFTGCTNLSTITINKAEGSITGAPWGAPSATVVWTG